MMGRDDEGGTLRFVDENCAKKGGVISRYHRGLRLIIKNIGRGGSIHLPRIDGHLRFKIYAQRDYPAVRCEVARNFSGTTVDCSEG
jgi:hypothetical protein